MVQKLTMISPITTTVRPNTVMKRHADVAGGTSCARAQASGATYSLLSVLPVVSVGVALVLSSAQTAHADSPSDCPPGATLKTSGAFSWCEPTLCDNDTQCGANELCRAVALCVEIGKLPPGSSS